MAKQEPYRPSWTDAEKKAAREALPKELGELAKLIIFGKRKGLSGLRDAIWAMNMKVHEASRLGITRAKGFPNLNDFSPIVQDLQPLVEFAPSSETIRYGISVRLRKAFADVGVEEEFLSNIALAAPGGH